MRREWDIALLLSLTGSALCVASGESTCSFIDLSLRGGSMENVSVRDQGTMGTCYAHAAADLYDAYRNSKICSVDSNPNRCNQESSAWEAAFTAREDDNDFKRFMSLYPNRFTSGDAYFGGKACEVVDSMIDKGGCPIGETMEPRDWNRPELLLRSLHDYFMENRFASGGDRDYRMELSLAIVKNFISAEDSLPIFYNPTSKWVEERGSFIGVDERTIANLAMLPSSLTIQRLLQGKESYFISSIARGKCTPRPTLSSLHAKCSTTPLKEKLSSEKKTAHFRKQVDLALNEGLPSTISICSMYLKPEHLQDGTCGEHAVSVIGRRWNTYKNRCEYRIQNSWGETCHWAKADYECENGRAWVDAQGLSSHTREVSRILSD